MFAVACLPVEVLPPGIILVVTILNQRVDHIPLHLPQGTMGPETIIAMTEDHHPPQGIEALHPGKGLLNPS